MLWNLDKRFHGERLTCTDEQGRDGRGVQQVRMVEGGNVVTADPPAVTPPSMSLWCCTYRGLRSGCRQLKLTAGICRLGGRASSPVGLQGRGGSSGERKGERRGERRPRPSLLRVGTIVRGERSPSEPEPSSSSLMEGSFFTTPPLVSESIWGGRIPGPPPPRSLVTASYFETFVCDHRQARGGRS